MEDATIEDAKDLNDALRYDLHTDRKTLPCDTSLLQTNIYELKCLCDMKDMKLNCMNACDRLEIEALESRRETLSLNFALKLLNSPHNEDFFTFTEKTTIFLRRQPILKVTINHADRTRRVLFLCC